MCTILRCASVHLTSSLSRLSNRNALTPARLLARACYKRPLSTTTRSCAGIQTHESLHLSIGAIVFKCYGSAKLRMSYITHTFDCFFACTVTLRCFTCSLSFSSTEVHRQTRVGSRGQWCGNSGHQSFCTG